MSRDKGQNKKAYKVSGLATKRKMKRLTARGGGKSEPGHKFVTFCPECERPVPTVIGPDTKNR